MQNDSRVDAQGVSESCQLPLLESSSEARGLNLEPL
jgi:hypothetical protein